MLVCQSMTAKRIILSRIKEAIEVLMKWRPSADVDEENYRYCNYTIEEIRQARKFSFDMPKTLFETKEFLGEVRKYYQSIV